MFNPWPNLGVFIILRRMLCISATKPLNNTNPPGLRSSISPSTPLTHLIKVGLAYKARGTGRLHLELFSCHWTYPPPPNVPIQLWNRQKSPKSAIHFIADRPISLAGWTALCRRAPWRWFAYTVCVCVWCWSSHRVTQLCIRAVPRLMLEMAARWEKHGNDRNGRPEGLPVVYLSKLGNCLLPIPHCHL